jgi:dTDP-4-dehydrorhamnose reductase
MIVLLGGSGYIGRAYQRFFERGGIPHRSVSRRELDYTDPDRLAAGLRSLGATFVINAAGYTGKPNVDACEDHKAECLFGNAVLPGRVRLACETVGVPWGQVSSGCIFSGTKPDGLGFTEEDAPNFSFRQPPCSFYSGSKALGEEVLAEAAQCYIWRLRIPFNEVDESRNYLAKLMRYARLMDATNSLSQLDEFVAASWQLWQLRAPFGIYNVTNPGSVQTHEIVEMIQRAGVCGKQFDFFADEAEFMRVAARTPRSNCVLDSSKLQRTGVRMTGVREALETALRNWSAQPVVEAAMA